MKDGVYIVYQDGRHSLYEDNLPKEDGMRVGICWHGHTWIIGKDYGDKEWSKEDFDELNKNKYGIMKEYEALFDWDYMRARQELIGFWSHIPFADDETMPTAPMVLVQEYLAVHGVLNKALHFCSLPKYETSTYRWFAERYNVYSARIFYGNNGTLNSYYVHYRLRVQAVTLWNPE